MSCLSHVSCASASQFPLNEATSSLTVQLVSTDLGISCRGRYPAKSCMKSRVSAPAYNCGFHVLFHKGGDLVTYCEPLQDCEAVVNIHGIKPVHHRVQSMTRSTQRGEMIRANMPFYEAEAVAKALCLAGVCGYAASSGWPCCWINSWCYMFHPPLDGVVSTEMFNTITASYSHVVQHERVVGIRLL